LDDFKRLEIHGKGKPIRRKLLNQDKGQANMVAQFIKSIKDGAVCPIQLKEIYATTLATFKVLESLRTNQSVSIYDG
jgi:polar amino acid transport system substrate-binding protein